MNTKKREYFRRREVSTLTNATKKRFEKKIFGMKSVRGKGHNKCKNPKERPCQSSSKNNKETSMAIEE